MNYQLSRLENGIRVITVPMQDRDSASVALWVRTGARFEAKYLSGMSHFLEHMLFKGTKRRSTRQIKEEIEGVGGILNAFTSEEVTCYYAKLLKEHLPHALEVLSDMVNHATLDPREMRKERTVILEEIKMYHDLPSHCVHDLMGEMLWPEHPLGRPISGTVETVSGISRPQMLAYRNRYYSPRNILVSTSGEIQHASIVSQVRDLFGPRAGGVFGRYLPAASRRPKSRTLFQEKQTEQTHFVIGMHGLARFHPDRYRLGLLNIILGANMSSRLFEEVREKRGLAYEIRSGLGFYQDAGSVTISAGVEAKKAPMAIHVILRELAKLRRKPVHEGELRRAKDYFMSQLYLAIEDTLEHLLWAGERTMNCDELPDHEQIRRSVESITVHDLQAMARKLFITKGIYLTLIGPVGPKMQQRITRDFEIHGP